MNKSWDFWFPRFLGLHSCSCRI